MPTPPDSLNLPQTAAELLEGLLRSQLFAESLFGQVFEQSRPYLDHPASEYASALVDKRVLTQWQATELLAGRIGLYAGTFRLLQRLARADHAQLFVAEQAGLQRLVMLHITRTVGVGTPTAGNCPAEIGTVRDSSRHPHIVRCIAVQQTPQLRLVVYEFVEAKPLAGLLTASPIQRSHAAHLMRQFAAALAFLSDEVIERIGLPDVWIDPQGQLKLLAGPNPLMSDPEQNRRSPQREALQLAAVARFAASLGGLPEIAECQFLLQWVQRLSEIAEPWSAPFESAALLCPRARMNRHLRRGPTLRRIESFGAELQFVLDDSEDEVVRSPSVAEREVRTEAEAETETETGTGSPPVFPAVRNRSRHRAWVVSVLLVLIVAAVVATQWVEHWGIRPAEATTEEVETSPAAGH